MLKSIFSILKQMVVRCLGIQLLLSHIFASWAVYFTTWVISFLSNSKFATNTTQQDPISIFIALAALPFVSAVMAIIDTFYVFLTVSNMITSFFAGLPIPNTTKYISEAMTRFIFYRVSLFTFVCVIVVWSSRSKQRMMSAEAKQSGKSLKELYAADRRFRLIVCLPLFFVLLFLIFFAGFTSMDYVSELEKRGYGSVDKHKTTVSKTFTKPSNSDFGEVITNSIGMKLVHIPAGQFMMGDGFTDESMPDMFRAKPQHKVRISKDFYIGVTEVTQAQWKAVMGNNPSKFKGDDLPVENVTWYGAVKFCKRMSKATGKHYRLPTEAQWEYACRGGTQSRYYWGDDPNVLGEYAWYYVNSEFRTHPVGQKKPNPFGLYDMLGNVVEFCSDFYHPTYYTRSPTVDPENTEANIMGRRVKRGGSWWGKYVRTPSDYTCSARTGTSTSWKCDDTGLRVVVEAE